MLFIQEQRILIFYTFIDLNRIMLSQIYAAIAKTATYLNFNYKDPTKIFNKYLFIL